MSVPRAHGDEPGSVLVLTFAQSVFPVPTGMNRFEILYSFAICCVPRAHGDEPQ